MIDEVWCVRYHHSSRDYYPVLKPFLTDKEADNGVERVLKERLRAERFPSWRSSGIVVMAGRGRADMVVAIYKAGANADEALVAAVAADRNNVVGALLEAGVDVTYRSVELKE